MMKLRPVEAGDESGLANVCLKTGDAGKDATALYQDTTLLAQIYALPYVSVSGGFGYVAEDDEGICGYVVGAADTAAFETALEAEWWPQLRSRYPFANTQFAAGFLDDQRVQFIHHPVKASPDLLLDFPAHIHMNVLPRTQGKGVGTRLLSLFLDNLKDQGASGVHAGVAPSNSDGLAFWTAKGLGIVRDDRPATVWCGCPL